MHRSLPIFAILAGLLAPGCLPAQEPRSAEAEIRAQLAGWLQAWQRQDADALATYYDEDADWTHAHGLTRDGKAAIHRRYEELFAAPLPDGVERTLTLEIRAVRMITTDVAVVDAEYGFGGLLAAPSLVGKGRTTVVMVKRGDRWLRSAQRNWIPMTPACRQLCLGDADTTSTSTRSEIMNQAEQDRRVDYIEFRATNIDETKRFYSEVFGWEFTDYGPDYTSFNDGRLSGGFAAASEVAAGGPLVVLYSTDLAGIEARVTENGGKIVREIFEFPGGRRFHFADPSENELAVWSDR